MVYNELTDPDRIRDEGVYKELSKIYTHVHHSTSGVPDGTKNYVGLPPPRSHNPLSYYSWWYSLTHKINDKTV